MHKLSVWLLGLAAIAFLWGGCDFKEGQDESERYVKTADGQVAYRGPLPNVVRAHLSSEPTDLHPILNNTAERGQVLDYCFQRLYVVDSRGEIVPQLAADSLQISADHRVYGIALHPEATWPDGAPVTAEDVLFSFKALAQNESLQPYFEFIDSVVAPTAQAIRIYTDRYYFLNDYIGTYGYVLDRRRFDPDGALTGYAVHELMDPASPVYQDPVVQAWREGFKQDTLGQDRALLASGSGPYELVDWKDEAYILLARREDYWGQGLAGPLHQQKPDSIAFRFIAGPDIELALKQQALDVSTRIGSQTWLDLRDHSAVIQAHYQLDTVPQLRTAGIILNNQPDGQRRKPFFNDKRVRRALALATPVKNIIEEALGGLAQRVGTPVPAGNRFFHPGLEPLPYSPREARRLLSEAGWRDSDEDGIRDKVIEGEQVDFEIDFYRPSAGSREVMAATNEVKEAWRRIGVAVTFSGGTASEFFQRILSSDFDAGVMPLFAASTPYDFKPQWHSTSHPGFNFSGFSDDRVDTLIDAIRLEVDVERQIEMAREVQEILYEEMPVIYFFRSTQKAAIHKRFNLDTLAADASAIQLNTLKMIPAEEGSASQVMDSEAGR